MNRTLLKVSGIFSIVIGIICCLTIIGCIVGIPMIIGGIKFNQYSKMNDDELSKSRDSVLVWSIVFLFINQISGVLGIVAFLLDEPSIKNSLNISNNKYDELEKLKKLYDDKVLTKEEFESEKSRILNK